MEPAMTSEQAAKILNAVAKMEARDWIAFGALIVAFITFLIKARVDGRIARHRETIGFLEKKTKDLSAEWKALQTMPPGAEADEAASALFGMLDTVALLIKKRAFDGELIYNYWWKYFYSPLYEPNVSKWIERVRAKDKTTLEHYCNLHNKWRPRIERELGVRPAAPPRQQ